MKGQDMKRHEIYFGGSGDVSLAVYRPEGVSQRRCLCCLQGQGLPGREGRRFTT
jgi:hypothetical protein